MTALIPLGFWAASGAGGGAANPAFELITTTVLASTATSVTFSGIDATYRHLQIRSVVRNSTGWSNIAMRLNGDSAGNYRFHYLHTNNATSVTSGDSGVSSTSMRLGFTPAVANTFAAEITDILDTNQSTKYKTMRNLGGMQDGTNKQVGLYSGLWLNTAAVTSITVFDENAYTFAVGSRFSLYGLRG